MAGSPTAAWLPKPPEQAPVGGAGPQFGSASASPAGRPAQTLGRATRPFRFGSEDRPDPDPPLGVGSVVGDRYEIVRLLGEGGMGRVYEARHVVLSRRVALKLLRRDAAAEPDNLARFRQEALAASRIGAPEIVEVVDFASHLVAGHEQTYMVMELLAGESLEAWMDRNARLDAGLRILASLCDGLAAAHRAAVVHRDIKPANVFLPAVDPTLAGPVRVKILDFGIAKITAGGEGFQTRQGALLGTPYYLAPERVMGAELTDAADLYSVGVILYEMLTGTVPFMATSFMGVLANHVHTVPLDPRQAAPDRPIPGEVAQLCLRLLSKEPRERLSAERVAGELRSLLARDSAGLAAVEIGPRGSSSPGGDTQILTEGTRELAISERPTLPPDSTVSEWTRPIAATPELARPRGIGRGVGLGLAATLGLAAVGVAIWFGFGSAPSSEADDQAAAREPAIVVEPPPEPTPALASEAQPAPVEPPAASPAERENREPVAVDPPKPERPKPKPIPKPTPEAEGAPAPAPSSDPPQPDPPPPKPEADPELPTIKDDVYD